LKRRIGGTSDPKRYRIRRKSGALGGFLDRIFRSESRFYPRLIKERLAFGAVHLLRHPLHLGGGAHLGVEPLGFIKLTTKGYGFWLTFGSSSSVPEIPFIRYLSSSSSLHLIDKL
jgi:hypothetical protein